MKKPADNSTSASSSAVLDPIRHVVVLMLENRSFDHMLGDATRLYPGLDGIPQHGPKYRNVATRDGIAYEQKPQAASKIAVDPPHEHAVVLRQINGGAAGVMGGFVDTYLEVPGVSVSNPDQVEQIMDYFPLGDTPGADSLPALHTLARNFLVCDRWFSSMPGSTWSNRFFAHSGTCLGQVLMPSRQHPEYMHVYNQDTVYDRLGAAGKSWRIYHDGIPQSIVMTHLLAKILTAHYAAMDHFYRDAAGAEADFPEYVFIEPSYFGETENDQHPPSDIAPGDQLIADVYNALRANEALWQSTLLIVTYDEHGGLYDHVVPPATVAPDTHTEQYSFTQLGVRVPAILISPWVKQGVCQTPFDHTSILRYVCDKWNMPPLGLRTAPAAGALQANSLLPELTRLSSPRTDTPAAISARPLPRMLAPKKEPPLQDSREALLQFVAQLPEINQQPGRIAYAIGPAARAPRKLSDAQLQARAEQRFSQLMAAKKTLRTNATLPPEPRKKPARKKMPASKKVSASGAAKTAKARKPNKLAAFGRYKIRQKKTSG